MLKSILTDPATAHTLKSALGIVLATTLAGLAPQSAMAQSKANIIGIDHVGINVPDIKQALSFFDDVLGFTPVTTIGPIPLDAAWKENNHMNAGTGAVTIKMVNAGTGASIELFSYENNKGSKQHPGGDDIGASHIAFYTSDIKSAVGYLKSKGVIVLGDPYLMQSGDTEGETWVYFLTPWGSKLELVSYPNGKGYEKQHPAKLLWSPKNVVADQTAKSITKALTDDEVKTLVENHLKLWNEQDDAQRKTILDAIYSPDVEMIDRHFIASGHAEVDSFIKALHSKDPDFRFSHIRPIETHHNIARLYWSVGNTTKPNAVTGMDLFVIENGKVQKLYVFVDGQ
jgi:catechol 2,3-dioxygenase-like lactoylglutathione lyase family enzyme